MKGLAAGGMVAGLVLSATPLWFGRIGKPSSPGWLIPGVIGAAWLGFAVAALLLNRVSQRTGVILILAGAVALVVAAGIGPPRSSDDLYRYMWDGRVQAAGVDPYRYAPAAPELRSLRDDDLWPASGRWCVRLGDVDAQNGTPLQPGCTSINRPTVHTVYPPGAQVLFFAVHAVPGIAGVRLLGAVFALATTVVLLIGLQRTGRDPRRAALWAWCPVVPLEAVSNAHIDGAAACLVVAALLLLATTRTRRGGVLGAALLGLAVAVKLTPLIVVPAVLRRWPIAVLTTVSSVVGLLYLPHVLTVGGSALGYLGGYAKEEGYASGRRFALIPLKPPAVQVVAVAVLAAAGLWAWWTSRPDQPWHAAALTTGVLLLLTTPAYPWYGLLLVGLVGLGARIEWLAIAIAGYVVRWAPQLHLKVLPAQRLGYGLAALVVLAGWAWRRHRRAHSVGQDTAAGDWPLRARRTPLRG
ncbi:MAG: glycosyltransferase family 87 protein [Actinomycetota bacterium]